VAGDSKRSFKPALNFDRLTPLFDPVVAVTTRERTFKRRVIERACLVEGERVLDLACGTGTLALAAIETTPGLHVVGADADPAILRRARAKAAAAGIQFDEAFSTELPYEDGAFDVVLSTLFFHHLEDDDKLDTAAEALRVLRSGGRLVVGDMGRPQDPLMRLAVLGTVQLVDGPATTRANVAGRLPGILTEAGFQAVEVTDRLRTPTGTVEILTATRA
jgi:ubiquinone/menaquinone biosynthesis C-methylase UbiE